MMSCDQGGPSPPLPPGSNPSVHGKRIKLNYCSGVDRTCEVRAWFADGRDCLRVEVFMWSECETDAGTLVCREDPQLDEIWKNANRTRCSLEEITWSDVADGGYRTPLGQSLP